MTWAVIRFKCKGSGTNPQVPCGRTVIACEKQYLSSKGYPRVRNESLDWQSAWADHNQLHEEALLITPSRLSVLIRELERQVGFRLFDRTTRQVSLTAFGSELLAVTEPSLSTLDAAMSRIEQTAKDKKKRYPEQMVTVIEAQEQQTPPDPDRIDWKLITDLTVSTRQQAVEKVQWYALRWKIEVFHKILKSGCRAEQARLRTAPRLVNLLAVFCILSWRVFWLTMTNRIDPDADPELVFTDLELRILDRLVADKPTTQSQQHLLSHYLIKLARLGGYLARNSDPPPGNETIWRGLTRLVDIQLGVIMGAENVGN